MAQILTAGPVKYREVAPIFIITGLTGRKELKKLADNLVYPTYCTTIPNKPWCIKKLAKIYAEVNFSLYIIIKIEIKFDFSENWSLIPKKRLQSG